MQRKVKKVFYALAKKGMVRAFIETGNKEYIYPLIDSKEPGKRVKKIYYLAAVFLAILLAVGGLTIFNRWSAGGKAGPDTPGTAANRQDGYGMTPLHHAVIRSDRESVKTLGEEGANPNIPDHYGWTPLHWAAFKKDQALYRFLVQSGASLTVRTTRKWFRYPAGITPAEMKKSRQ